MKAGSVDNISTDIDDVYGKHFYKLATVLLICAHSNYRNTLYYCHSVYTYIRMYIRN